MPLCVTVVTLFASSTVVWVNSSLAVGVSGLPDDRAYEQVTPTDKNGLDALGSTETVHASPSGEGVSFDATGAFPGVLGAPSTGLHYVAFRREGHWATHGLFPPAGDDTQGSPEVFSLFPDLSKVFVSTRAPQPAPGGPSGQFNLYEQDTAAGSYQFFVPNPEREQLTIAGVTPDDSHFIFESRERLLSAATPGYNNLYEWSNGQIDLVGVLPGGGAPGGGSVAGASGAGLGEYTQTEHAISDDGSRVFFTDHTAEDIEPGNLYVRENADASIATTVEIAETAKFQTANADGSWAFFTKGEEHNEDLYAYNVRSGQTSDIAPNGKVDAKGSSGGALPLNGVLGVGGVANDTRIYFAAQAALTGAAITGQLNIYVAHYDGEKWKVDYITTFPDVGHQELNSEDWVNTFISGLTADPTSRVTPNGETLLFGSTDDVSGYNSDGYREFYLYEAASKRITCVSCARSNEPGIATSPRNDNYLTDELPPRALSGINGGPGRLAPLFPAHNLSDSGTRVFFETEDALLPQDTNDSADVYEWEKGGSGGCGEVSGCLFLISTGQGSEGSYFGDASASGDDVFFFTHQQLVPEDEDELQDVYDARVGGAVVSVTSPACSGTGCQGVAPAAPVFATPASMTFSGVGNFGSVPKAKIKAKPKRKTKRSKKHRRKAGRKRTTARGANRPARGKE